MMLGLISRIAALRAWGGDDGESGQGLVEYSLILSIIAVACIVAVTALGNTVVASPAWKIFDGI